MDLAMPEQQWDSDAPAERVVVSTTEARQGVTFGRMRWVLGTSLAAVVILFLIVYFAF
jgi:hypothetical protein